MLPCASINTTLPWIPTYPYSSIVITYPSTYATLPTVGKIPLPTLSIYLTYPIHVTSAYIAVPTSHYLLLHTPSCIYYCQGLIEYNAEPTYQIKPKLLRPKRLRSEMTQTKTTRECSWGCGICRVVHLIIWLSILVRVRIFWTSNIFVIIVFPYTHDTGVVTGTEPGEEFYTLPLMRNSEKMAELTYAELTQGRESTHLPHAHLCYLKK